jgi:phytoene dehydrogenase-like protein
MDIRSRLARDRYDAVIVGAGPNGLAAAVTLAGAGASVAVLERGGTIGGGSRTAELTEPGFRHDVCSAIHPLGVGSPFFRSLPLREHGLEWIHPPAALAHPLEDGRALLLKTSLDETASGLGEDGPAWRALFGPLTADWDALSADFLRPLLRVPRHPFAMLRFAWPALRSAAALARSRFATPGVRALFAGLAGHAVLPLDRPLTASFGLVFGITAHAVGWPLARGGSQAIADALASLLRSRGGEILTGAEVSRLDDLPPARAVLLDLTPRQVARLAGERLPARYRRRLERFRYGPGVFKLDVALDGPVPWAARECAQAGTVHLGATLEEIAAGEAAAWQGVHAAKPFVLAAQQSLFDSTRAPAGKHTLWAYCHVPHGSTRDMTEPILAQVERFAPGFRARIRAIHAMGPAALQDYNPNYIGGDITGGAADFDQLFGRPAWRLVPYATPLPNLYLCSSSTPPGGGVHGMCGYLAARAALRRSLARSIGA